MYMLARAEKEAQKKIGGLEPSATHVLLNYSWPGNVRELESACTKLVTYTAPGGRVTVADLEQLLPDVFSQPRADLIAHDDVSYEEAFILWEREFLKARVERFRGAKSAVRDAALTLKIDETTLRRGLKRCGLPTFGYE
jgi:transcriptional regulator with PAS, ATPase and Fis domain